MRRRSSPEKNSDRVENLEGNGNLHNDDRGVNGDSIEPLREALDELRVGNGIDRVDGIVDETESASASSLRSEGESSSSSRQRHSSIQRVEHLHRFVPPNVSADSAPIVNVLPGPVLPMPGAVPQGFEVPPLPNNNSMSVIPKTSAGLSSSSIPGSSFANMWGSSGTNSKFSLGRNPDSKAKKSRNINCGSSSDGNAAAAANASGGGMTFQPLSGSPRSSSLWGSRAAQANLLSHPLHGAGAVGGAVSGAVASTSSNAALGASASASAAASYHPMTDAESSPTPRRRNGHPLATSSTNTDHAHLQLRSKSAQNTQNDQQSHPQAPLPYPPQAQVAQLPPQPQLPNLPQPPQNQPQQLSLPPPQHQQQPHPPPHNQPQNQPQNQLQQQQPQQLQQHQQQAQAQAQGQAQAQRQENNNEDDPPNPFDLNNEMELGIGHLLKDRMASLCANDILADVEFIVGTPEGAVAAVVAPPMGGGVRTIPAHKCILVTSSSVFYAMFCGGLANRSKDGDEIRVPDVDPEAFMAMLRYIYSEEINLEPESVLPTLYAAKKYMVNPLANECINYLEKNLKPENVCVILMQSKLYDEEELAEKCSREIDMHTEEVLNSEGFLEVDHDTLQSLVIRDGLSIPEIRLFEAVVRWAAAECLRRGLEPTPEQKRQMLGPVLHLIRIPTISLTDFSNYVSKSGLLTPEECVKMFQYFTADDKPGNLDFICEPRRKVGTERRCRRFPYFLHVSSTFYGLHSIAFKASRKVAIVGFGLYGWAQGCACHVVTAQLMYQGNVIAETHQRITAHCPEDEPTYRVKFDNPVEINADVLYSACVILNGAQSYYGMDGKERCEADGVTFVFLNSMDGSNGTNVEHGQIPEIIFTEPH